MLKSEQLPNSDIKCNEAFYLVSFRGIDITLRNFDVTIRPFSHNVVRILGFSFFS